MDPWLTGVIADYGQAIQANLSIILEQLVLRLAMLVAVVFPIFAMLFAKLLSKQSETQNK